jgi:hypothetical protein
LLLPDKFKPLGITKYDAKQDPIQWLRCYALSIENAGGNSDTKCLYFPFCLHQAPLTWLESLDKHSIDKWDQLKEQFTSNFTGYMRRFFDKRATVVDVTDKEVIDLFQDGLYHRRTFKDFGRRRPRSIPHLKDMITSWRMKMTRPMPSTTPSAASPSRTRAAAAAATRTRVVATTTTTTTTTQVPTASASQTTPSRLSSALRKGTRRRTLAVSKTC